MPDIDSFDDPVVRLVGEDVFRGLDGSFEATSDDFGDGFSIPEWFLLDEPVSNSRHQAVAWEYRCVHSGEFRGLVPTSQVITIRGVTFVEGTDGEEQLRRYVDWADLMAQLGMTWSGRPALESIPGFSPAS